MTNEELAKKIDALDGQVESKIGALDGQVKLQWIPTTAAVVLAAIISSFTSVCVARESIDRRVQAEVQAEELTSAFSDVMRMFGPASGNNAADAISGLFRLTAYGNPDVVAALVELGEIDLNNDEAFEAAFTALVGAVRSQAGVEPVGSSDVATLFDMTGIECGL